VAYPISSRHLQEMRDERGVSVAHSTRNRWVIKSAPEIETQFRARPRPVGKSWRLDETYVKIPDANGFCGHKRNPPIEEAIKKFWSQFG
jgi:putative transposase